MGGFGKEASFHQTQEDNREIRSWKEKGERKQEQDLQIDVKRGGGGGRDNDRDIIGQNKNEITDQEGRKRMRGKVEGFIARPGA